MEKLVAGAPETRSADIVADNLERLQALFPEAFTEGKVDFAVLRQLLGDAVDDGQEKYGLNWHGKRRARQLALTPSTGTLRPCPEDSVDWETTQNLMIEGDNLEVLKLLRKSYAGKVKLIYIDPPYNTGRDFVYPDNYGDSLENYLRITGQIDDHFQKLSSNTETSGRFHTVWLNMIYPRLKLGRDLLRSDGYIFVSCDDGEISGIRKICDEIFGEENFVDTIVWKKRYGGGAKEKYLVTLHEYIVMYAKDIESIDSINVRLSQASIDRYYTLRDEHFEERGPYRTHPLEAMKSFEDRPNLSFPIRVPDGSELRPKRQWRWSPERMSKAIQRGEVEFVKTRNNEWAAYSKQYLNDETGQTRTAKVFSIIDDIYTQHGTNEIVEHFGDARIFPFPKPSRLVKKLVELSSSDNKDDLVVDYFAGSGATADAVVTQNVEDNGTRRVILIQLPEILDPTSRDQKAGAEFCDTLEKPRTIAELTKERLRRVGAKVKSKNPDYVGDLGFRVFKLDTSNIRAWDPNPDNLEGALLAGLDHIEPGRTEQDILYELLLKLGLDLCVPIETKTIGGKSVHSVGAGTLFACLDEAITRDDVEPLAAGIADWHGVLAPAGECTVVFRDSAFADDVAKTNLAETLKQRGLGNVRSL